jgi:hypothetical protein
VNPALSTTHSWPVFKPGNPDILLAVSFRALGSPVMKKDARAPIRWKKKPQISNVLNRFLFLLYLKRDIDLREKSGLAHLRIPCNGEGPSVEPR